MMDQTPNDGTKSTMVYDAQKKSVAVCYFLWFFLGAFGTHRFYAGTTGPAIVMLVLFILGFLTVWIFGIGLIFLIPLAIWVLIDVFLIPGTIRDYNVALAQRMS